MSCPKKIFSAALLLWLVSVASLSVFAQSTIKKVSRKEGNKTTFGIQVGRETTYTQSASTHSKNTKTHYTKTVVLRHQVTPRFKVETGLNFGTCDCNKQGTIGQINKFSLPLTLQYYFLSEKYKVRPYCGAGVQGNIVTLDNLPSTNTEVQQVQAEKNSGTKNITILFTQGVTFEVNTKIQVNQSLHFIPGSNTRTIGIDFGVGYKFP